MMKMWIIVATLILLDAGLTLYAVNVLGFWEVNPIMRVLSLGQFIGVKALSVAVILGLAMILRRWRRINLASGASTIGLYAAVIISNIWELL